MQDNHDRPSWLFVILKLYVFYVSTGTDTLYTGMTDTCTLYTLSDTNVQSIMYTTLATYTSINLHVQSREVSDGTMSKCLGQASCHECG